MEKERGKRFREAEERNVLQLRWIEVNRRRKDLTTLERTGN